MVDPAQSSADLAARAKAFLQLPFTLPAFVWDFLVFASLMSAVMLIISFAISVPFSLSLVVIVIAGLTGASWAKWWLL